MTEKLTDDLNGLAGEASQPVPPSAGARPVSFARWIIEGWRASFLLRPRIPLQLYPGPWKLACLVLLANLIDVFFDWLSLDGEVRFNTQGWLVQWSLGLFMLWFAWCFMPRARIGNGAAGGRVLAWFALQFWALMLPLLFYYSVMYWTRFADEQSVPAWLDDRSMSMITLVWVLFVFFRLTQVYFESWLRALALTLTLCLFVALPMSDDSIATWVAADDGASQVEVVPGDEESDDGTEEPGGVDDTDESGWLEAMQTPLAAVIA